MKRKTFEFGIRLEAPASTVWNLITDTQTWTHWGPSLKGVDSPERFIRGGLMGRILTPIGIWLPFKIERFDPGAYWDWRVAGVIATGHRVESRGPFQCELTFTVPTWAAGYGMVCRVALSRVKKMIHQTPQER